MTEWNVLLVLAEIIALFFVVGKPLINLNTTITTLKASVDSLREGLESQNKDLESFKSKSSADHKEFYQHLERHDLEIADHEHRLKTLEEK